MRLLKVSKKNVEGKSDLLKASAALIFLSLCIILISIMKVGSSPSAHFTYAALTFLFIIMNLIMFRVNKSAIGLFDWFEPPILLVFVTFILLIIPTVFYWNNDYWRTGAFAGNFDKYFVDGLVLLLATFFFMWLSYNLTVWLFVKSKVKKNIKEKKAYISRETLPLWAYVFSVLIRFVNIGIGNYGYFAFSETSHELSGVNSIISLTYYLGLSCLAIFIFTYSKKRDRRSLLLVIFSVSCEIVLTLFSGMKLSFFSMLLVLFSSLFYSGLRVRMRWIIIALIITILLVEVNQAFRIQMLETGTRSQEYILNNLSESTKKVVTEKPWKSLQLTSEGFFYRTSIMLYFGGLIKDYTPDVVPYAGFNDIANLPIMMIPRFLWPGKPSYQDITSFFMERYLFQPAVAETTTNIPIWGDFYRYKGWISLAICSLAWGLILALVYILTAMRGGERNLVLYISLFPLIFNYEMSFPAFLQNLVQNGLAIWLLLFFFFYKEDKNSCA